MRDITDIIDNYRECVRHLWNKFFYIDGNLSAYTDQTLDSYELIVKELFQALVLEKVQRTFPAETLLSEPIKFIRIVPRSDEVPVMINRSADRGSGYWDDPVKRVKQSEIDLRLIGFFDWDSYGYIDLRYFRSRIVSFTTNPHLVGRDTLLEVGHARVYFDEDSERPRVH